MVAVNKQNMTHEKIEIVMLPRKTSRTSHGFISPFFIAEEKWRKFLHCNMPINHYLHTNESR